jgi:hypothetical protein
LVQQVVLCSVFPITEIFIIEITSLTTSFSMSPSGHKAG